MRLEIVRRAKQVSCLLTDLGSAAGTWHNGVRLRPFEEVRLRVNDLIELGAAAADGGSDGIVHSRAGSSASGTGADGIGSSSGSQSSNADSSGSSSAASGAAIGEHQRVQQQMRRVALTVAGADVQPPVRATAAALRHLPKFEVAVKLLTGRRTRAE